jgi:hypothetical protein
MRTALLAAAISYAVTIAAFADNSSPCLGDGLHTVACYTFLVERLQRQDIGEPTRQQIQRILPNTNGLISSDEAEPTYSDEAKPTYSKALLQGQ